MDQRPGIEARVVDLECRFAFLEESLEQLNAVVARQDAGIERLEQRLQELVAALRTGREGEAPDPLAEPPPPHY